MKHIIILIILFSFSLSCTKVPDFLNFSTTKGSLVHSISSGAITLQSIEKDNAVSAVFSANSNVTQVIEVGSSGSAIEGVLISVPGGALQVETSISLEQGSGLASSFIGMQLGLENSPSIEPASNAVVISSGLNIDLSGAITVGIPVYSEAGLLLSDNKHITVVYKIFKAVENKYVIGVIPETEIEQKDGKVYFETKYFGSFQVAYSNVEITEKKEQQTDVGILTKTDEKKLKEPSWDEFKVNSDIEKRSASISVSLSDAGTIKGCSIYLDKDKNFPWDKLENLDSLDNDINIYAIDNSSDELYIKIECLDNYGRFIVSDWASGINFEKLTPAVSADTTGTLFTVSGRGVSYYQYAFVQSLSCDKAVYSEAHPVSDNISFPSSLESLSVKEVSLCVIGKDLGGNEASLTYNINIQNILDLIIKPSGLKIYADSYTSGDSGYDNDGDVYFVWNEAQDNHIGKQIDKYTLNIYDRENCGGSALNIENISGTNYNYSLSDGTYSFIVRAIDNDGSESSVSDCSAKIIIDTVSPVSSPSNLIITSDMTTSVHDSYISSSSIYLVWDAAIDNEGGAGISAYDVYIYAALNCTGSIKQKISNYKSLYYQYSGVSDNSTYSFKVVAYDYAGNVSSESSCSSNTLIDTTAPVAASNLITPADSSVGPDVSYDDDSSFYFVWDQATDSGSGVESYTLHRYNYSNCVGASSDTEGISSSTLHQEFTGAVDGAAYSFKITAYDYAGNSATSNCSTDIIMDTSNPIAATDLKTAPDLISDEDASYDDDTTIYFTWTSAIDAGSGLDSYTLHIYNSSNCGTFLTDITNISSTMFSYEYNTAIDGSTYSFKITAYDKTGRSATSNCSSNITIDASSPISAASNLFIAADSSSGAAATYDDDSTVYFKWDAATDNSGGSGIKSYSVNVFEDATCSVGSMIIDDITSNFYEYTNAQDGTTLSFNVVAYDYAGNAGTTSSCSSSITIDNMAPFEASNLITPADISTGPDASYDDDNNIYLKWDAATDTGGSGIASYTLHLFSEINCGGTATDTSGISSSSTSYPITGTNGTTYSFKITAYDYAGNSMVSQCSTNITIDTTPPSAFSITSPVSGEIVYDNTLKIEWSDPGDADSYDVFIDQDVNCPSPDQTYSGVTDLYQELSILGDGSYYICITAYDNAGNSVDASNNNLYFTLNTGTWSALSGTLAPSGRRYATAVWDNINDKIMVWGGYDGSLALNTGGVYYPTDDTWSNIATSGAPSKRYRHSAVWTGSTVIIWGGWDGTDYLNTGGIYDVSTNTWTSTDTSDPDLPDARKRHSAVWTGSDMIIWGGNNGVSLNSGAIYNKTSNSWTPTDISDPDLPTAREDHTAIWTGSKMIIWGGVSNGTVINSGAIFDPSGTDYWAPISTTDAPSKRTNFSAVWTGSKMIIWGGYYNSNYLNDGAIYDPSNDTWTAMSAIDAPSKRSAHIAVWDDTDNLMIIWGGIDDGTNLNDGAIFDETQNLWKVPALNSNAQPAERSYHIGVWTGNQMVVWGGYDGSFLQTGGKYSFTP